MVRDNKPGVLHVVAVPIGNLGDITARALETLESVDIIAAEDTRVSLVLLRHFHIQTKIISYHKFNEQNKSDALILQMQAGASCALISDAGTPCISDPGAILVGKAVAAGIPVTGVPGPCALAAALSVAGFPINSFAFYGFFPKGAGVIKALNYVKADSPNSAVFYESPLRIIDTIKAISTVFPNAQLCLCNDLTKKFELLYRGAPIVVLDALKKNPNAHKGEYTLVFNKNTEIVEAGEVELSPEAILVDVMVANNCDLKTAVSLAYSKHKRRFAKKELYSASLRLKNLLL